MTISVCLETIASDGNILAQPQGILGGAESRVPTHSASFLCVFDFENCRNNRQLEIWETETKCSKMPVVFHHTVRIRWNISLWYLFLLWKSTLCLFWGRKWTVNDPVTKSWPRTLIFLVLPPKNWIIIIYHHTWLYFFFYFPAFMLYCIHLHVCRDWHLGNVCLKHCFCTPITHKKWEKQRSLG